MNDVTPSTANTSFNFPGLNEDGVNLYNQVQRTVSGHMFEIDDTAGNERISRAHAKGTEEVWDANGGRSLKVMGRNYELVVGDNHIVVTGQCSITVNGDCGILCEGDLTAKAKRIDLTADEDISLHAGTGISMTSVAGDFAVQSGGGYRLTVEGEANERFQSKLDTNIVGDNDLTIGGKFETLVAGIATQHAEAGTNITSGLVANTMVDGGNKLILGAGEGGVDVHSGGVIDVTSIASTVFESADFTIESGPVLIKPEVNAESTITADGDIVGGEKQVSINDHTHTGVSGPTSSPLATPA